MVIQREGVDSWVAYHHRIIVMQLLHGAAFITFIYGRIQLLLIIVDVVDLLLLLLLLQLLVMSIEVGRLLFCLHLLLLLLLVCAWVEVWNSAILLI